MLREHGAQRPTAFEILNTVHRLRGTKSRFTYDIPEQVPLSPRSVGIGSTKGMLDDLVTYKPQSPVSTAKNNGIHAREKVLEAIAPMRRGRPEPSTPRSRSTSPRKEPTKSKIREDGAVPALLLDKDQSWRLSPKNNAFVRGHKSGVVTSGAWRVKPSISPDPISKGKDTAALPPGFDNNFLTNGFGDSFGGSSLSLDFSANKSKAAPIPITKPQRSGGLSSSQEPYRTGISRSYKARDAFEGLGLAEKPPVPTLAEARTARTGPTLPLEQPFTPKRLSPRPPSSPQHRPLPSLTQVSGSTPVEERYPPIEDLDRTSAPKPGHSGLPQSSIPKGTGSALKPSKDLSGVHGSRSQTVTGTSMYGKKDGALEEIFSSEVPEQLQSTRPPLVRGYSPTPTTSYSNPREATDSLANLLSRPSAVDIPSPSRDWLTGDDQENIDILSRFGASIGIMPGVDGSPGEPVLRDSPSKRASFIEKSPHLIAQPLEGNVEQIVLPETALPSTSNVSSTAARPARTGNDRGTRLPEINGDVVVKGSGLSENWSPLSPVMPKDQLPRKPSFGSVSSDDGPEDPDGGFGTLRELRRSGQKKADVGSKPKRRQSSVHDLVDLWGGSNLLDKDKKHRSESETNRSSILLSGFDTSNGIAGLPRSSSPSGPSFPLFSTDKPPTSSKFIPPTVEPERKPTSNAVASRMVNQTSRPSSSSNTQTPPRSRPQSMLVFPSKSSGGDPGFPSPSLAVPSDKEGIRTISRSRRTSITDIVQRYEGIGGPGTKSSLPGTPSLSPSIPPKPVGFKPPRNESQNIGSSHTRFIKVSPTNSPVIKQGLSLNIPEEDKTYRPGSRTSPTTRISPRRSPTELGRSTSSLPQPPSTGDDTPEPKSPSPERPYAGVSKLIDQWQKKAEESNPPGTRKPGTMGARRFGVGVGGGR